MSTTQRKRRGGAVNSRQARKRNRLMASTAEMASEAEPIELEESVLYSRFVLWFLFFQIVQSGRLIVSTKCGHVFCSQCLRDSLRNANSCPTCRKKLTHRQYHPIYI
ncbi:E3 ubiquitin-protein ligase RNF4-like [Strix aluco]|uniref:E3 ubiquitin-protein ligase RNF4-like n=1 Tax=Strix aluco TaxID=111821 RepID=UPI003DA50E59